QHDEIERAALELQKTRQIFVDDADFDDADLRQHLVLHLLDQRGVRRIAAFRKANGSIMRIRFKNDARSALPFAQSEWTGADRARANVAVVRFDDFTRNGGDESQHVANVRIVGLAEADLQRVAIERTQPFDSP